MCGMGKLGLLLASAAVLAACDHSSADSGKCAGFGFEPGSEAYATCLMQQDQGRRAGAAVIAAQNPYLRY
jgi:hypothetical protein